ncbi:hypothetical protein FGB62_110g11 [Gracilaria domingensis]|nr:hypothetical protein FGB62_110g11 [Gracilaria domingensis]
MAGATSSSKNPPCNPPDNVASMPSMISVSATTGQEFRTQAVGFVDFISTFSTAQTESRVETPDKTRTADSPAMSADPGTPTLQESWGSRRYTSNSILNVLKRNGNGRFLAQLGGGGGGGKAERLDGARRARQVVDAHHGGHDDDERVDDGRLHADVARQVAQQHQPVADVLVEVAVVQAALRADAAKARRARVAHVVRRLRGVALRHAQLRVAQHAHAQRGADRHALAVHRLHQPAHARRHALLVEQQRAGLALDGRRVEQRHRRVDHRVAVLQAGLQHVVGQQRVRQHALHRAQRARRAAGRQRRQVQPAAQLEEHADAARRRGAHRVRQRGRLGHQRLRVAQRQRGGVLELDGAAARAGAHDHDVAVLEVRLARLGERARAVRRPHGVDELRVLQRVLNVVARRVDGRKAGERALGVDAALFGDGGDGGGEGWEVEEAHAVAVLRVVEGDGAAAVAGAEHGDVHGGW